METAESFRSTGLTGMKEISSHVRMSEVTVLKLIRKQGLPAKKVGGQWISDATVIKKWWLNVLASQISLPC